MKILVTGLRNEYRAIVYHNFTIDSSLSDVSTNVNSFQRVVVDLYRERLKGKQWNLGI